MLIDSLQLKLKGCRSISRNRWRIKKGKARSHGYKIDGTQTYRYKTHTSCSWRGPLSHVGISFSIPVAVTCQLTNTSKREHCLLFTSFHYESMTFSVSWISIKVKRPRQRYSVQARVAGRIESSSALPYQSPPATPLLCISQLYIDRQAVNIMLRARGPDQSPCLWLAGWAEVRWTVIPHLACLWQPNPWTAQTPHTVYTHAHTSPLLKQTMASLSHIKRQSKEENRICRAC